MDHANLRENNTLFSTFPKIDDSEYFSVKKFMQCTQILLDFFALWGARFYIVKNDVDHNIKKVSSSMERLGVTNLRDMLAEEKKKHLSTKDSSGSIGLLWLKRTYQFLIRTLFHLSKSTSEDSMRTILQSAYNETLQHFHNGLMRGAFRVVVHSLPRRATFIRKLALDHEDREKQVLQEASECVQMIQPIVQQFDQLLIEFDLETVRLDVI